MNCTKTELLSAIYRVTPHLQNMRHLSVIDAIEAAALHIFAGKAAQSEDVDIIRDALLEYMQNKVLSFKNEEGV